MELSGPTVPRFVKHPCLSRHADPELDPLPYLLASFWFGVPEALASCHHASEEQMTAHRWRSAGHVVTLQALVLVTDRCVYHGAQTQLGTLLPRFEL